MQAPLASRVGYLDVVRGAAVGLVVLEHGWGERFPGAGIVGVVLFFVLSGYLITGVLVRDADRQGTVDYRRFYAHRAFRLLPALLLFLTTVVLVELSTNMVGDASVVKMTITVVAALLYLKDFPIPGVSALIAPLWTLSVEEQFYLIWPGLLARAVKARRTKRLLLVSTAVILVCLVASIVGALVFLPQYFKYVYSLPTTWSLGLVIGAAAQLFKTSATRFFAGRCASIGALSISLLVVAGMCFIPGASTSPLMFLLGGPLIMVAGAVIVTVIVAHPAPVPFYMQPLRWLGTISYAVYLWNYAANLWLNHGSGDGASPGARVEAVLLTLAVATLSWFTVEAGGRRLRDRFDSRQRAHLVTRTSPTEPIESPKRAKPASAG
jgi:peptidoglycan/LPS O-acetylase OafA/YrhL